MLHQIEYSQLEDHSSPSLRDFWDWGNGNQPCAGRGQNDQEYRFLDLHLLHSSANLSLRQMKVEPKRATEPVQYVRDLVLCLRSLLLDTEGLFPVLTPPSITFSQVLA